MKKVFLILIISTSLLFASQTSNFKINAYKMNPVSDDEALEYEILFINLYEAGARANTPIMEGDNIPFDVSTISSKPTEDGGYYTELFQISIAANSLADVSLDIDGPESFVFNKEKSEKTESGYVEETGVRQPPYETNHKIETEYSYYLWPENVSRFENSTEYGADTSNVTYKQLFGSEGSYLDGGWVECKVTVSLAIENKSEIEYLTALVNAGAVYELPYKTTVTVSGA